MADVRFTLDSHQVKLVMEFIGHFLQDEPRGEAQNLIHSIAEVLYVRFGKRAAERRLEHKFILPVYQALALRRLLLASLEYYGEGRTHDELRRALGAVDPKTTRFTVVA